MKCCQAMPQAKAARWRRWGQAMDKGRMGPSQGPRSLGPIKDGIINCPTVALEPTSLRRWNRGTLRG